MIGVPVPSIRICACRAGGDGTGETWANSSTGEVDAMMRTAALTVRARHRGERVNDERLIRVSRVGGVRPYRELDSTASEASQSCLGDYELLHILLPYQATL